MTPVPDAPVELDWLHTFPCRFGNTSPDARDGSFNGKPIPGDPFASDIGARWCSARWLADTGAPSDFRATGQGGITQMGLWRTGVVSSPGVFVLPLERLPAAIRCAEALLTADRRAAAGVREWTPAYGACGSRSVVGLHVAFLGTAAATHRRAFAATVGADWVVEYAPRIPTPENPERRITDRCTVSDTTGTVRREWSDGRIHLVDSGPRYDQLPDLHAAVEAGRTHPRRSR